MGSSSSSNHNNTSGGGISSYDGQSASASQEAGTSSYDATSLDHDEDALNDSYTLSGGLGGSTKMSSYGSGSPTAKPASSSSSPLDEKRGLLSGM